jgi:octaprenyl-diphosphate synthase
VLLGDCLFAHALKLCSSLPKRESNRLIAEASSEVVTGEILQMQRRFDLKLTLPEYLRIISMKTGALFRVACETSALLNDMPEPCVQALRNYGDALGVAYQIYDDCLDLYGTEESSGKTLGTDLKKGKFTLPLIHLLQHLKEGELASVSDVIVHGDEAARLTLLKQVIDQGGVRYALRKANEFLDKASRGLEVLPDTEYRNTLRAIPSALSEHLETLKA